MARQRVLIIGSSREDSVGDSYRRALAAEYDVRIENPMELGTLTPPAWTRLPSTTSRTILQYVSNGVLRDPYALVYPKLLKAAAEFAPDIVLVTTIHLLAPRVVAGLRSSNKNARVIGVFSDAISNFGRGYFFDADYDAIFFKDRYIVNKLRAKLGWSHVYFLPQACDPTLHRPVTLTDADRERYGCEIALAGNLHYFRAAQMAHLDRYRVRIWGAAPARWLKHPIVRFHQGREVIGEEKSRAMRAAAIVLNNNHYAEIAGVNKRTFEAAAMQAFQLTDTPALRDVFVPDEEVATFDTLDDLLEKVEHYLPRPELRDAMAARAYKRAVSEHTYAHRWVAKMVALGVPVPHDFPIQPHELAVRAQT